MRKQKGFSLIELLIVVAIILIIAAIAIPSLVHARMSANEASAATSVRTINTAQVTYQSIYPTMGYANSIAALGPPASTGCPASGPVAANACLIDFGLPAPRFQPQPKPVTTLGWACPPAVLPIRATLLAARRLASTRPECVVSARTKMA